MQLATKYLASDKVMRDDLIYIRIDMSVLSYLDFNRNALAFRLVVK